MTTQQSLAASCFTLVAIACASPCAAQLNPFFNLASRVTGQFRVGQIIGSAIDLEVAGAPSEEEEIGFAATIDEAALLRESVEGAEALAQEAAAQDEAIRNAQGEFFFVFLVGAIDSATNNFKLTAVQSFQGESIPAFGAAFKKDPVIYFAAELTNPTSETGTFFYELTQELLGLDEEGDVQFEARLSAVDNNGDGASATASGFGTITDDRLGSPLNTIIDLESGPFVSE